MATKKVTEESITTNTATSVDNFKANMIALGNEMIEKVRGKQVDVSEGIDKVVAIYNAVK